MESFIEKVSQISIEGKETVDILNEISQQGEIDISVPKRTITLEGGQVETIFVFDFSKEEQATFEDFQDYFIKEEGFEVLNQQEEAGLKASELQKGSTKILLVNKGDIVVEDRLEGFLLVPEVPEAGPGLEKTGAVMIPLWVWVIVGLAIVGFIIFGLWRLLTRT